MSLIRDGVGWAATAVFVSSYLFKGSRNLRVTQASAALLWIVYGVLIGSLPVIGANVLVSSMAAYSAWRTKRAGSPHLAGVPPSPAQL